MGVFWKVKHNSFHIKGQSQTPKRVILFKVQSTTITELQF